ncbi:hypothetical protein HOO65_040379 [Ceratocystis lukuohia]|uniref:Uncharacterized protein n=1 Tax=Ceratocystis lukuohia TaxID=2019550 RepID=A0ABR4MID1_9PEZI
MRKFSGGGISNLATMLWDALLVIRQMLQGEEAREMECVDGAGSFWALGFGLSVAAVAAVAVAIAAAAAAAAFALPPPPPPPKASSSTLISGSLAPLLPLLPPSPQIYHACGALVLHPSSTLPGKRRQYLCATGEFRAASGETLLSRQAAQSRQTRHHGKTWPHSRPHPLHPPPPPSPAPSPSPAPPPAPAPLPSRLPFSPHTHVGS